MRPARPSLVPGGATTRMRSKPEGCRRKSVTAQECPPPSCEASTVRPPNHCTAWFISTAWAEGVSSGSGAVSITSLMAATVWPGMVRNHSSGGISLSSSTGSASPRPTPSGRGCTKE